MILAWLVPATIATLQSAAGYATRGVLAAEWPYAALQFPRWMSWALATPFVFAMQRRYPLSRGAPWKSIGRHALASIGVSLAIEAVWLPVNIWVSALLNPGRNEPIPVAMLIVVAVLGRLLPGAFTYAAVLGVASTLESREALRRRDVAAEQLRGQLAAAQLGALKMQVHPHFLFNTLQAINVLITQDPPAATRMVARLGDLLRTTLSRAQAQEVTLADEIDIVRLYLDIERVRFAEIGRAHV